MKNRSSNHDRRRSRRGITIIEVLIVVSGVSMLLAICAVSIQALLRANSDAQHRYRGAVAIERLARQFREDVHASTSLAISGMDKTPGSSSGVHIKLDPRHIVFYKAGDGGVIRNESKDAKIIAHQTYTLPSESVIRFEHRAEAGRKLAVLVYSRGSGKSRIDPPRPVEIVAVQGRDRVGPIGTPAGERPK